MPCNIGELIKNGGQWATGNSKLYNILSSPFWTAILVVIVILLLVLLLGPTPGESDESDIFTFIKLGAWIFLSSFVILFLHDSALRNKIDKEYDKKGGDEFVNRIMKNDFRETVLHGDKPSSDNSDNSNSSEKESEKETEKREDHLAKLADQIEVNKIGSNPPADDPLLNHLE